MIRLLEKFLFPALMLIASIEVLFCNSHDVAPRGWVVVVGATTLLICSCLEYVIPQNPEWNYFTRENGMRWWVLGRDSTSFAFASTLTDAVRFSLCIWLVGTLSPLFGPRVNAKKPLA